MAKYADSSTSHRKVENEDQHCKTNNANLFNNSYNRSIDKDVDPVVRSTRPLEDNLQPCRTNNANFLNRGSDVPRKDANGNIQPLEPLVRTNRALYGDQPPVGKVAKESSRGVGGLFGGRKKKQAEVASEAPKTLLQLATACKLEPENEVMRSTSKYAKPNSRFDMSKHK